MPSVAKLIPRRARRVPINITFDQDLLDTVDAEAFERGQARSELVREALRDWFRPEVQELVSRGK
jgi:metal-responsive CopG/Arc/MetJ family transcriptional regulator